MADRIVNPEKYRLIKEGTFTIFNEYTTFLIQLGYKSVWELALEMSTPNIANTGIIQVKFSEGHAAPDSGFLYTPNGDTHNFYRNLPNPNVAQVQHLLGDSIGIHLRAETIPDGSYEFIYKLYGREVV